MAQPKILLVDDDYKLVQGLRVSLLSEGYDVMTAPNGQEGLKVARRYLPDLIVLDINMPWMDGLELCRRLRQDEYFQQIPILFLTSNNSVDDRIVGLDMGADDYLGKPFNIKELKAHVRALLRRSPAEQKSSGQSETDTLQLGPLTLNLKSSEVVVGGSSDNIQLTPVEFDLLHYLMRHPQQTVTSEDLLEKVWSYAPGTADTSLVRWHIKNLRTKIEPDPARPVYLRTVPRHGYILDTP
ncbi:MAG: response regulator transcription factor [Ardenticatenaceae bacterium]|nr:response regulator transcription factor [Ardenticatenaceae bacterium]MCB9444349.1 response regulator transcription factor [Ardenticatenaceae bacterium]